MIPAALSFYWDNSSQVYEPTILTILKRQVAACAHAWCETTDVDVEAGVVVGSIPYWCQFFIVECDMLRESFLILTD